MKMTDIRSHVGKTPLITLNKLFKETQIEVLAKLEFMNPGGSIKDRPAYYMLEQGIKNGTIKSNSHIIESSSGNLAISLAMFCKLYSLKFTAVVDPKISPTNLKMIELYGASIIQVSEKDINDGYLLTRIEKVKSLLETTTNSVWVNQYANPDNWKSHYYGEAEELANELKKPVDYLVISTSTSGTLMGVSRRLKEIYPKVKVIAVDLFGSVLFGGPSGPREIPGIGASRVPELLCPEEVNDVIYVDDYESAIGCHQLIEKESIFAGGSSGSNIAAILKLSQRIPKGSRVLTLLPDRGDRYLDLIYNDTWVDKVKARHEARLSRQHHQTA